MNPFTSVVDWLAKKVTIGIFSASGTDPAILDAFDKATTMEVNDLEGNITVEQASTAVSDDIAAIKKTWGYLKIGIVIVLIVGALYVIKRFKYIFR